MVALLLSIFEEVRCTKCPSYEDVVFDTNKLKAFEFHRFEGRWFEIASHNVEVLTTGCHCTHYSVNNASDDAHWGDHFFCNKGGSNGELKTLNSTGYFSDDAEYPGKLTEKFNSFVPRTAYWVLDVEADSATDSYDAAFVYACVDLLVSKDEYVYIFQRTPELNATLKDDWLNQAKSKGIDVSDVKDVPMEGCSFNSHA